MAYGSPLQARQSDAVKQFGLYAYAKGINGLPVFFADGKAQIGYMSASNATLKRELYFTTSVNNSHIWEAHVNITEPDIIPRALDAKLQQFENNSTTLLVYLAQENSNSTFGSIAFTAPDDISGKNVAAFDMYGTNALITSPPAAFYAVPNEEDKFYSLMWSTAPKDGYTLLSLTTMGIWRQPPPPGVTVV